MSEAAIAAQESQLARVDTLGAITRIETSEAEQVAVDGLAFVQTLRRNVEKARKELVDPLNLKVKEVNSAFRPITDRIEKAEDNVKEALLDWRRRERDRIAAEQERVRRENEERYREAAEKVAKQTAAVIETTVEQAKAAGFTEEEADELAALEGADVVAAAPAPLREVAPAPVANTTKATLGAAVGRMVWRFEVTDEFLVPRGYLVVDEPTIRRAINRGVRDIPGVRIFQEEQIAGRSAS
jgi:hypothetical protein